MTTTTSNDSAQPRALVYSSHLSTMGSWSRLALALAHTLNRLMPTQLATPSPVSAHVAQWTAGLKLVPYEHEMAKGYDLLWNVDIGSYAEPVAKRNLAWVIAPHYNNVPPPQFELFAISEYVQSLIERFWQRISHRLYPWVPAFPNAVEKERVILHLGRFIRPNDLVDSGHLLAIEQFKKLCLENELWNWQLVLLGALVPGQGDFLDQLQEATLGHNIKILANADQQTVNSYLDSSALLWNTAGFTKPDNPLTDPLFPFSIVEGAAAGSVPIAGNRGANPEFIIDGYNGLLIDEPQQFAEVTKNLIRSMPAWAILSQRSQATSQGWKSEDVFLDRIRAVLQGLPSVKPPVPRWLDSAPAQDQVVAVIATHNQVETTKLCLNALAELNPDVKVVLVDNGSTDDMSGLQTQVEKNDGVFVRRTFNDGLGAAMAAAKPFCDRRFVLLMHNDSIPMVSGDWLDLLLAEMNDENVGVVGAKLIKPDAKTVQFAGWRFITGDDLAFFHFGDGQPDEPRFNQRSPVIGVSSACMVCRTELFEPDEKLQIVYCDLDLCIKAKSRGFQVIYQPASTMVHIEGTTRNSRTDIQDVVVTDKEYFFRIHGPFGRSAEANKLDNEL